MVQKLGLDRMRSWIAVPFFDIVDKRLRGGS